MLKTIKYTLLVTLVTTSMLLTACGGETPAEATQTMAGIQTIVAETVAAQAAGTSTPAVPIGTQTPLVFSPTLTPSAPTILPTRTLNPSASACGQASLVSETIPDGTIYAPGQQFTKTWEIKNTSNCSWDTSYKIIFWDGDILGGAYVYNLPQAVDPGQTVPISLLLTAPANEATYTSKWMLQTPDGGEFGVGQYNAPFYAEIAVSSASKPNYGVTSVEYNMVRDPATGCPANVNYTLYADITTSGPVEIKYYWVQSDGNDLSPKRIKIDSATTTTLSREWKLHIATDTGTRWIGLVIMEPEYKEYPHVEFIKTCGG